ncbi:MAG: hypothetical protein AVDCRST_MAG42-1373, partial [uncultured Chthoniobacterales bacterium]
CIHAVIPSAVEGSRRVFTQSSRAQSRDPVAIPVSSATGSLHCGRD